MSSVGRALAISVGCLGCTDDRVRSSPGSPVAVCARADAEKLGVPFVQICPADLPAGMITSPMWIAKTPIGCMGGKHETVPCPVVTPLARAAEGEPVDARAIAPAIVQMVDSNVAHRTCMLRFGGRLPTSSELALARDALGLVAVIVSEPATGSRVRFQALAEWTTTQPCTEPSRLGACKATATSGVMASQVPWRDLRACRATPAPTTGASIVGVGDDCPRGAEIPCLLGAPTPRGPSIRSAFVIDCSGDRTGELAHPTQLEHERAAFRCVLPEAALTGTIKR